VKALTRQQLYGRKDKAVSFVRHVLGDSDRAQEIEGESLEDYAQRRRIKLINPKGVFRMATQTRRELLERIDQLESENEDLQEQLDSIADIVAPPGGDTEEEDDDEGER
jgi:hypothetical protein